MPAGKSGGHFFLFRRPRRAGARGQTGSRPKAQLNGFSQRAPGSKGVLAAAARHGCPPLRTCTDFRSEPPAVRVCPLPPPVTVARPCGPRPNWKQAGSTGAQIFAASPVGKGVPAAAARHGCPPLQTADFFVNLCWKNRRRCRIIITEKKAELLGPAW